MHARSPAANIDLVEATNASGTNVGDAITYAATSLTGVSIVSMSFTFPEGTFVTSTFSQTGVAYLAATGDVGSYGSVEPNDLGTYLAYPSLNTYISGSDDNIGPINGVQSYGPFSGDFTVVTEVEPGTTSPQAGISIRNGTSGTAGTVAEVSLLTNYNFGEFTGGGLLRRSTNGGTIFDPGTFTPYSAGTYLAVGRIGTSFYSYSSSNGVTWSAVTSVPLQVSAMSADVMVDLVGTTPPRCRVL